MGDAMVGSRTMNLIVAGLVLVSCLGCDTDDVPEPPELPEREAVQERLEEDWEEFSDAVIGALEGGFAAMEDALDEAGVPDANTPTPANRDEASEGERSAQMRVAEEVIVEKTNAHRAEHGLDPLEHSDALAEIAHDHSKDMVHRSFYAHDNPDGLGPHDRIEADLPSDYQLQLSAENIANRHLPLSGSESAGESIGERFVEMWMGSSGHRENILRDGSTHIGVGLYAGSTNVYATQKFITDGNHANGAEADAEGGVGIQ